MHAPINVSPDARSDPQPAEPLALLYQARLRSAQPQLCALRDGAKDRVERELIGDGACGDLDAIGTEDGGAVDCVAVELV